MTENFPEAGALKEVVSVLRKGGVVALPTETVYGLGVLYNNKKALQRLYMIKGRPRGKPCSLCVPDMHTAFDMLSVMPPFAYRMAEEFWPGPLTIVYHKKDSDDTAGIRISSHRMTEAIMKSLHFPVALASANISGQKEATTADEVERMLGDKIDIIVDGGPAQFGKPSTVIDLTFHPFKMIREGVVPFDNLMRVFFKKRIIFVCTGNTCRSPMAEYILKNLFDEKYPFLKERYDIFSRGIISLEGQPASPQVKKILDEQEGVNAGQHRSKRISRYAILSSDLIFVMEEAHKEHILRIEPTAENRVFTLKKFLPSDTACDIPDPISKPFEVYGEVYSLIKEALTELVDWLS